MAAVGTFCLLSCGDDKEEPVPEEFVNHTIEVNDVKFDMIAVEGGTFTMGATAEQGEDAEECENPTHEVTLDNFHPKVNHQ